MKILLALLCLSTWVCDLVAGDIKHYLALNDTIAKYDSVIVFERGVCRGLCSAYRVALASTGDAFFCGVMYCEIEGELIHYCIDPDSVIKLFGQVEASESFQRVAKPSESLSSEWPLSSPLDFQCTGIGTKLGISCRVTPSLKKTGSFGELESEIMRISDAEKFIGRGFRSKLK